EERLDEVALHWLRGAVEAFRLVEGDDGDAGFVHGDFEPAKVSLFHGGLLCCLESLTAKGAKNAKIFRRFEPKDIIPAILAPLAFLAFLAVSVRAAGRMLAVRAAWFETARFGAFVCWGHCSQRGIELSWPMVLSAPLAS